MMAITTSSSIRVNRGRQAGLRSVVFTWFMLRRAYFRPPARFWQGGKRRVVAAVHLEVVGWSAAGPAAQPPLRGGQVRHLSVGRERAGVRAGNPRKSVERNRRGRGRAAGNAAAPLYRANSVLAVTVPLFTATGR